eukprot:10371154-Heterocapsa_arctica.AAC.1
MPISYPQHTSGFIPGFIPRFHTPQHTCGSYPQHTSGSIPGFMLVSHPQQTLFHTPVRYRVPYLRFHA